MIKGLPFTNLNSSNVITLLNLPTTASSPSIQSPVMLMPNMKMPAGLISADQSPTHPAMPQIIAICIPSSSNLPLQQPSYVMPQQIWPTATSLPSTPLPVLPAPSTTIHSPGPPSSTSSSVVSSPTAVIVRNPQYCSDNPSTPEHKLVKDETLDKWQKMVLSDAKDLEEFAKYFKAKRIELGYTQEMVANDISKKMGYSCQQAVICYFEKMQMSNVRMHRLKSLLERWLQEATPANGNIPSLCRPRKRRSSTELFPFEESTSFCEEKGKDVVELVKRFRTKRKQLGISQQRAAEEMQAMHGRSFSQAFISLFETLQMSFTEASQFKHYFEEWINTVDRIMDGEADSPTADNKYSLAPSRKKIRIDPKKKATLEVIFGNHPNPKPLERKEIAESLDLPANTVQNWFAFRRHKEKQLSTSSSGLTEDSPV